MPWYYVEDGRRVGPLDEAEFQNRVGAGRITDSTLVWRDGMEDWTPYGEVRTPAPEPALAPGTVRCAECGRTFPEEQTVRIGAVQVCAECKPRALQKLQEGAPLETEWRYGGFWIRAVAKITDSIIVGIGNYVVSAAAGLLILGSVKPGTGAPLPAVVLLSFLLPQLVAISYATFFVGRYAATPGKMLLGLKVVCADGSRVSYARALGRYFAEMLSGLILCIGYIMAAFDEQKRTLHDHICGTRVVHR